MSINLRLGLIFSGLLFCAAVHAAQQSTPSVPAATSTISLDVVVTPKSGPPLANLGQQDFTILDNKTPQPIKSFEAFDGSGTPIHVILVVDGVNSSYQNLAYERGQIEAFLHANGGRLAQPLALAFFTDDGAQIQNDFTTNGNALSAALDQFTFGLRSIRRSSQYGAMDRFQLSLNALLQLAAREASLPGRKMILWVSPGWPLLSGAGVQLDSRQQHQIFTSVVDLSNRLRRDRITVYSVDPLGASEGLGRTVYYQNFIKGVSKQSQVALGDLGLQVLAAQSGGLALSSGNDIADMLQRCLADAQAYYVLSFDPPAADHANEYHHLEIMLTKPGLTARTREGYYAQP
jgi:VWFA-related protein